MKFSKKQIGFTFIEVLMSLFLLNIFLCGLIKLQLFSIQESSKSYLRTVAIIQAKNLIALVKIQKNMGKKISSVLNQWQRETKGLLPLEKNYYDCNSIQCQLTIEWQFQTKQQIHLTEKI